ncbi:MAG: sensor histidine kinase, partial [Blautia sp.]|nr:sensor histidine kinase [Blautia sp.]
MRKPSPEGVVRMIRKLRMKFVIVNMAIVVVMLGFIFALVLHFTSANLETESIQMMQTIAGRPFRPEIPGRPDLQEQEILLPYFMVHMGPDGEMLTLNGGFYDLTDEELMGNMVKAAASSSKVFDVIPEYNLRFYKQNFPGRQCIVFADISSERSTLDSMIKTCGIIGFFSLVVF